jgi:leishmanolysin
VDAAYKVTAPCQGSSLTRSIAAPTTIGYFNERGLSCAYPGGIAGGTCVAKFVTETAVAVARDFSGCDAANGIEIEGQDTTACALQASHLEQTRWSSELMCPYAQHALYVGPVTLAVLQDSGWYRARWEHADGFRPGGQWGYKQGCDFALGKCIQGGAGMGSPPHYFTATRDSGSGTAVCTVDRKAVGYADVSDAANPPPPFQYWPSAPARGGTLPAVFDFCA